MPWILRVPADHRDGWQRLEQACASIHAVLAPHATLTLGYMRYNGEWALTIDCPPSVKAAIAAQIYAAYPDARLIDLAPTESADSHTTFQAAIVLCPDVMPLHPASHFRDPISGTITDPVSRVLAQLDACPRSIEPSLSFLVRRARPRAIRQARATWYQSQSGLIRWSEEFQRWYRTCRRSPRRSHRILSRWVGLIVTLPWRLRAAAPELPAKLKVELFEIGIVVRLHLHGADARQARTIAHEVASALAPLVPSFDAHFSIGSIRARSNRMRYRSLFSAAELALLWHAPHVESHAPHLAQVPFRELEVPALLPAVRPGMSVLGEAIYRGHSKRIGLVPDDRFRHVALLGKTGTGKSTLLAQLLASDIAAGSGVMLVDPHGDLAETVLSSVPRRRTNDVILFDAADVHPIGFNPLHCDDLKRRALVVSGVLSAFKKLWHDSWGPRLEYILRNALLACVGQNDLTLVSLHRFLNDVRFRHDIVQQCDDPIARAFWEREFPAMPERLRAEAMAPVQNKVGAFVSNPFLRSVLDQPRSRLRIRTLMDHGQVLICNLSKGRLGEDASQLLGSFLITAVQLAAMSRADVAESQRRPFFLTVDEFGSFATESFAAILSEARKYRLALTLANQYLDQIDPATRSALTGNVGSQLFFQIGQQDAEQAAAFLGDDVTPADLLQLPRYHAYARLLVDGQPLRPFVMRTLRPSITETDATRADVIRRVSTRTYTQRTVRPRTEPGGIAIISAPTTLATVWAIPTRVESCQHSWYCTCGFCYGNVQTTVAGGCHE